MKKYLIIVEKTESGYSAYSPDLPGCGSTGGTKEEVERNIQEAIQFHIEGLREDDQPIPVPASSIEYVEVRAALRTHQAPTYERNAAAAHSRPRLVPRGLSVLHRTITS